MVGFSWTVRHFHRFLSDRYCSQSGTLPLASYKTLTQTCMLLLAETYTHPVSKEGQTRSDHSTKDRDSFSGNLLAPRQ